MFKTLAGPLSRFKLFRGAQILYGERICRFVNDLVMSFYLHTVVLGQALPIIRRSSPVSTIFPLQVDVEFPVAVRRTIAEISRGSWHVARM